MDLLRRPFEQLSSAGRFPPSRKSPIRVEWLKRKPWKASIIRTSALLLLCVASFWSVLADSTILSGSQTPYFEISEKARHKSRQ